MSSIFSSRRSLPGSLRRSAAIALVCVAILGGQTLSAQAPVPDAARTGYEAIDADDLRAILTFLASDELEGRGTAQRGLQVAAKFLQSQYTLAGLTPAPGQESMLQVFHLTQSQLDPATSITLKSGSYDAKTYPLFEGFYLRASESSEIEAPVVFAGYGLASKDGKYDDYKGVDVKGKIVLILGSRPAFIGETGGGRNNPRLQRAKDLGAVAILGVSPRPLADRMARIRRFLERPSLSLEAPEAGGLPQFTVSAELANAILASSGETVESLKEKIDAAEKPNSFVISNMMVQANVAVNSELVPTQNVVAYLEGSDPQLKEEVVVFGAHYDHTGISSDGTINNGADDDGSGTSSILEIARAFASNPQRTKRSLLFVSHAGEERGLLGSSYYTDNPVIPLDKTIAQLNVDMIGRNEDNHVYIIGSDFISTELHQLNENANKTTGLTLDYKYNSPDHPDRFYFRSDHYNYAKHGVPIIFYFTGTHEDYHQPTDDVEKIKFDKLAKISKLIYLTGWKVANLDHHLEKDGRMMSSTN